MAGPRSPKTPALHLVVWAAVYTAWLLATRHYHPTWTIALLATGVLVSTSALAVYTNRSLRARHTTRDFSWSRSLVQLLIAIALLDIGAVLLIQFLYDALWGPDPNRFGFWFNVASDGAIIALHVAVDAGMAWWLGRRSGRS